MSSEEYEWRQWREETWLVLLSVQSPVCVICGRAAQAIDHDHETGIVRGLLCHGCNALEGGPGKMHPNHVRYREHPPAEELSEPIFYRNYPKDRTPFGERYPSEARRTPRPETMAARIVALLAEPPGVWRPSDMAERLGVSASNVRANLHRMKIRMLVRRVPNGWRLAPGVSSSKEAES